MAPRTAANETFTCRTVWVPLARTTDHHVQYEWENGKAAANLRKHGVDFADAIAALEDTSRVEDIDTGFVYDDERIQIIGMAHGKCCS